MEFQFNQQTALKKQALLMLSIKDPIIIQC
jgi:hypothetical protein